ncbi:mitochondrial ribosomal protein L10 [Rhynchophorus ferrugineus]|uniref:Large ribosomal subunit protein uL10m n=1 Tax=Rhynchophorus ferrugineus TaxID=354439 RepID=A0A834MN92_RHYFE|nr:hypothetical protein GWI33_002531 [Rhynchophorus ferrugineus]
MALIARKAICSTLTPLIQIKRFRGKINIQRPRAPHFERAKYLALTKPWFLSQKGKDICEKLNTKKKAEQEFNPFQNIIAHELYKSLNTSKLVTFCHYNPMTKEDEFNAYVMLHKEGMHFKKVGKETVSLAVKGTHYETILDFYISHNMIIFSPEPKIKKLLKILRKFPQLIPLAAIYENKLISKDELIYYSEIPDLQAAQALFVQTLNNVGSHLLSNLNSHQTTLVSHLQQRSKQLEESE